MNDSDHSSIAANGPHRDDESGCDAPEPDSTGQSTEIVPYGESLPAVGANGSKRPRHGLFARVREALMIRGRSTIRADLTEALEDLGTSLPGSFFDERAGAVAQCAQAPGASGR